MAKNRTTRVRSALEFTPGRRLQIAGESLKEVFAFFAWPVIILLFVGAMFAQAHLFSVLHPAANINGRNAVPLLVAFIFISVAFAVAVAEGVPRLFLLGAKVRVHAAKRKRERIGADLNGSFILYLRPFYTDDESFFVRGREKITLQRVVAEHLWSLAPVKQVAQVADGGAVAYYEDVEWRERVAGDMENAIAIVLFPLKGPGTIWEIRTIVSRDLLNRAIFVMPSSEFAVRLRHRIPDDWNAVRADLSHDGISLPLYQSTGGVFRLVRTNSGVNSAWLIEPLSEQAKVAGRQLRRVVKAVQDSRRAP